MNITTRLAFIHALSPLHAGAGRGTGVIDLPIAREKATGLPFLPGSSLKGALRARCNNSPDCHWIFGSNIEDQRLDTSHASSVQFSDQHLLLLPVRSLTGTFAWVTSPYVLRRFARDIADVQITPPNGFIPIIQNEESCIVANATSKLRVNTGIYLEDLELKNVQVLSDAGIWARWIAAHVFPNASDWQEMLIERFCIVHDDVFNFLIDVATEVTARIRLQPDTKLIQDGSLWYEEFLPTETILSGIILAKPTQKSGTNAAQVFAMLQMLTNKTLQIGGGATVGRGMCRVVLVGNIEQEI